MHLHPLDHTNWPGTRTILQDARKVKPMCTNQDTNTSAISEIAEVYGCVLSEEDGKQMHTITPQKIRQLPHCFNAIPDAQPIPGCD
jgi:hypothetical protein